MKSTFTKRAYLTIALCLINVCLLYSQAGTTQPLPPSNWEQTGAGTSSNPYLISNLANLRWFSENSSDWWINADTQVFFRQTNSIDASETENWNGGKGFHPIGHWTEIHIIGFLYPETGFWFVGDYDGDGYNIDGLHINQEVGIDCVGLFSKVYKSTIKNIHLDNLYINATHDNEHLMVGGIGGRVLYATIENCGVKGIVNSLNESDWHFNRVGGTLGFALGSTISGSYSESIVVGKHNSMYSDTSSGGIVGITESSIIVNSFSSGEVSAINTYSESGGGETHAGGILGESVKSKIEYTFSTSKVFSSINGVSYAGGLVGRFGEESILQYSFFAGDVSIIGMISYLGGIAGRVTHSEIGDCFSEGTITDINTTTDLNVGGIAGLLMTSSMKNSYTTCKIIYSEARTVFLGGLAGVIFMFSTIENSFWDIEKTEIEEATGITMNNSDVVDSFGLTTYEMKQAQTYIEYGWDFEDIWMINPLIMGGYPYISMPLFKTVENLEYEYFEGVVNLIWEAPSYILHGAVLGYLVNRDRVFLTFAETTYVSDDDVAIGETYLYEIIAVYTNPDGFSKPVFITIDIPLSNYDEYTFLSWTKLVGNFPNPFNPNTTIYFEIVQEGNVSLEIFNIRGQKIRQLVNDFREIGHHQAIWNGTDDFGNAVGSGMYFYRMTTDDYSAVKRMMLLK